MAKLATVVSILGKAWAIAKNGQRRELQQGDEIRTDENLVLSNHAQISLDFGNNQQISLVGEQELSSEQAEGFLQQLQGVIDESASTQEPESEGSSNVRLVGQVNLGDTSTGHNFVNLVRIGEAIEADGLTPFTVARIQETLKPFDIRIETLNNAPRDLSDSEFIRPNDEGGNFETGTRLDNFQININAIAGDDIVNSVEASGNVVVSGTAGGGVRPGDAVTVMVNGQNYQTTINPDGTTWQVKVPGSELAQDTSVTATVESVEFNGNPVSETIQRPYDVDTQSPGGSIIFEPGSAPDGSFNEADIINGKVEADVSLSPDTLPGDNITIIDGQGNTLISRPVTQGDIDNGITVDVPVQPGQTQVDVTLELTDPAGNTGGSSDSNNVDNVTPTLSVSLEGAGPDGVYNDSEIINGEVTATITLDSTVAPGDIIEYTDINGNPIVGLPAHTVTAGEIANGSISVQVPIAAGDAQVELNATISDVAGNSSSAADNKSVDNVIPQLSIEIEGEGSTSYYDAAKISNGQAKVTVKLTAGTVDKGDQLVVKDSNGNTVIDRPVTQAEVTSGEVDVLLSVAQGQQTISVEAIITDSAGNSGNDTDSKVILSPELAVDSNVVDDSAGTIDISGSTTDVAPGTDVDITITDKDNNTVTVTVQTDANGDYTVSGEDISGLTDGPLDIKAETEDHNGNTIDDTVTDIMDHVAGDLTVDSTTVDDGAQTVDINGSSTDVHPGETVTITIKDQGGNTVTTTATVQGDGSYEVTGEDISSLVDGPLEITAEATDNNGKPVSGTGNDELDNLAGAITVEFATDPVVDAAVTEVTGTTTDVAPGEIVTLTFTDQNSNTQTTTAVVANDGTYAATIDLRGLTDGNITVDATATDRNSDPVTGNDAAELDAVAAGIAIDTTSVDDTAGTIDISGSTTDVAPNTTVTITITDKDGNDVTTTATTDANGDYVINGTDISGLTDGDLTITAEATDHNGDLVNATATDTLDYVAGDLTVDSTTVDDGAQTVDINGSTTDVHPGETVTVTIKDQDGNTVTTTATVQTDGSYEVTGENISSLVDGPLEITAEATDNNGKPVSDTGNDELDNLTGSMTVAFTNDPIADPALAEVAGTTVDVAPGETVNLTFTDVNGQATTATAVVASDGTYTTTVDLRGLTDGEITVDATATDRNSTGITASNNAELDAVTSDIAVDTTTVDDTAGTIDIAGSTTDVAPGTDVDITITDKDNNTVTVTVQTDANGDYTVSGEDISGLTDGPLDIKAETEDHNGNTIDDTVTDIMDHVAGDLTVDSTTVDDGAQTVDINGSTTDVHPGETVTVTIKDQDGNTVTTTTTVQADGSYEVTGEDISSLVDGPLEITAEATDNNGNPVSGTGNDELGNLAGAITVEFATDPVVDAAVTEVTGTTTDVAPGEIVTLTFTDQNSNTQTTTAVVANDGTYTTTVDLRGLTDGGITVDAAATDRNSDPVTGSDAAVLDAVASDIAVDTTAVDDSAGTIDISGSTIDVAPNTDVDITITDKDNNTVTVTVQTDANGDYTVSGEDISGLTDGPLDIKAETEDHNGNTIDDTVTDIMDHVAGDLTVDSTTVDDGAQTVDINGSTTDVHPGETVTVTIKDQDGNTVTTTTTVQADGSYEVTGEDISSLVDGPLEITAEATDNNGNPVSGTGNDALDNLTGSMTVTFTNDPIADPALAEVTGTTIDVAPGETVNLTFTDVNGQTTTATAVVASDGTYTTTVDLRGLTDGDITVAATATDRNSAGITASNNAELDAVTSDIAVDTTTVDDSAGTIDISGSTTDVAPGTDVDITITDKDNNTVTVTVQTDANGDYTVSGEDISGLTDGDLTITAATTDHNGNTIDDTATDVLDHVAGNLTVDSTGVDDTNQTVDISGSTTDVHPGETVTVTIKDQDGNTVTTTTTVQADGSYDVTGEDISSLVDGPLEITAEATDNNGNPVSGTGNDELDNLAGAITVEFATDPVVDAAVTEVTGTTTDVAPGEIVTLTFTDQNSNTQTTTAVVANDGTYAATIDLRGLTDGNITVDATATDRNSGPVTGNDAAELDAVAAGIAIDTTSVDDTAGTIDIAGSTTDVAPNTTVTITITDKDGNDVATTATTDANGDYVINGTDISGLTDGDLTITAEATDHNGDLVNATATDTLDYVAGDLTVDSTTVDDGAQTVDINGSTTDVHPGETVTVTIKDQDGNTVTTTATVQVDGSYEVTGEDISSLVDGPLEITAEATDNNGDRVSGTGNDELDNTTDTITVNLDDVTSGNEGAVAVSGTTTGVLPGETVELTFSDGTNTTTTTATVGQNGNYQTSVDLSGLNDGNVTVEAETDGRNETVIATDNASKDSTAPTLEITSINDTLESGDVEEVTFTFSEEVTGFDATDITVAGGTLTNLNTTDNITWTADFTADGSGNISIKVPDDSYTDVAGNLGAGDDHVINAAPTISAIDGNGGADGHITVSDKGIGNASDNSEAANGTLRVTAPTGLESITIGGTEISLADLQALPGTPQTINIAGHGELTINSFTPTAQVNGENVQWDIDYSYELTQAQDHSSAGPSGLLENISLGVKAESITGPGSITGVNNNLGVLVEDDVPNVDITTGAVLENIQAAEATIGTAASKDYSAAFTKDFGADGAAASDSLVYSFEVTSASGLADALTGNDISLSVNGNGDVVGTVDGSGDIAFTITVDANGVVELTQNRAIEHTNPGTADDDVIRLPEDSVKLKAIVEDGDGDIDDVSISIGNNISFVDSGPEINSTAPINIIDEKHLGTGSDPSITDTVIEQNLDINFGADGADSLVFTADQQALLDALYHSGNGDIDITVAGNTITGVRDPGGSNENVFTVTLIIHPVTGQASYNFELQGSMKHFFDGVDHQLNFKYEATDGDGDIVDGNFRVDVVDDAPESMITITTPEDQSYGPFTVSADAPLDKITIYDADGVTEVTGTPSSVAGAFDFDVAHGTVTITADGSITYVPDENYSNNNGEDKFFVEVTEDNINSVETTEVIVNVTPVADAPDMDGTGVSTGGNVTLTDITTNEDTTVALGLSTPAVIDNTDQNGSSVAGDNPERLGEITLTLSGGDHVENVNLSAAADGSSPAIDFDFPNSGTVDIWITDIDHPADLTKPAGALEMTSAQYEGLQLTPSEHRSENIDISIKASSYEVDGAGNIATVGGTAVPAAESEATLKIYVQAVTDDAELVFDTTATSGINNVDGVSYTSATKAEVTINEDAPFKLNDILSANFEDLDGSEVRSITIENTTGQTIMVDGVALADGSSREVDAKTGSAGQTGGVDSFPDITLGGIKDFSGDLKGINITINAQDKDSDGFNSGNEGDNVDGVAEADTTNNSIELDLFVKPIAGDIELKAGDITTAEDTAVAFMQNIEVTDNNVGGSNEVITQVAFELPTDWQLTDQPAAGSVGDAVWTVSGDGSNANPYTIEFNAGSEANRELALKQFEITPPAHSSKDETIDVTVTTTDTNTVDGSSLTSAPVDTTLSIPVEVTPVAERTDSDSDGANGNDVTMTLGYSYTTAGEEDTWFGLSAEAGFNLGDNWSNEGSTTELTFAQLTPVLIAGDGSIADATGSSFRYNDGSGWVEETFGGDPINVPVQYLDTLEFKAAKDFSGSFEIAVEALTRDYDEDDILALGKTSIDQLTQAEIDGLTFVEDISGSATLENVLIAPVADVVTATVTANIKGNEDEQMPLSIRPKSSDPSEVFNVTVSGIPDGSTITYDGQVIDATTTGVAGITVVPPANPGEKWSVEFTDFDPVKGDAMTMTAPKDSNESFVLDVSTVSVDTLEITGDPNSPYTSTSAPQNLQVRVSPKGVADEADVEIVDVASQTFTEESVEANGGINLTDLITKAELSDDDGSEKLTFKVDGLPEGFGLSVGTVTVDGTWSLTAAQLQVAKITTPNNFSGDVSFNFTSVTTENDGDSLSKTQMVDIQVDPTPEATINLSDSVAEDTSGNLSFAIEHQNGDTDERLDEVWIKASDADNLANMELTFGQNGVSLADAATSEANVSLDSGWYKLSGTAINNIYAQGNANWAGNESFDVHYVITDPAQYPLGSPNPALEQSQGTDASYQVTVTPVTDTPELAITSSSNITMAGAGTTTVDLSISNQGGDYDDSETLARIVLENVPDGVTVQGADYFGDGTWVLTPETAFNGVLTPSVTLEVGQRSGGLSNEKIKVIATTEDADNGNELEADQEITLSTNFPGTGSGDEPADIETWEQSTFEPTEDTAFTLNDAITGKIEDGVTNNNFTITLKNLPAGAEVTGMVENTINGETVWSATSSGDNADLQALLDSITVKPPEHWNSNKGNFDYDAKLTTYLPGGVRFDGAASMSQQVTPVTDDAVITITAQGDEGSTVDVAIDATNSADDPNWTLVDGKLYLTINEPVGMQGGQLQDASGNPLSETAVTGVPGVADGNYYVVNVDASNQANLKYQPKDGIISGDVGITAVVVGQETGSGIVSTTENGVIKVNPVNSGYDFSVANASGTENELAQAALDNSNLIEVSLTDNGLVDADGSEEIGSVLLNSLPNGFLVYAGADAASATLADNIGADGNTNTWLIGIGSVPGYVGILPPANWSGSLTGLGIVVNSKETALDSMLGTEHKFDLDVEAVANGITINPTASFGNEGEIITLNLNAEMEDLQEVILNAAPGNPTVGDPADGSIETATLQLKGLGEHASFYIGEDLISDGSLPGYNVSYNDVSGVYTIEGLSQDDLGKLGFIQAEKDVGSIEVRAQTVESANSDTSAWTHDETDPWASVTTNINKQFVTSGDDTLLWNGSPINGRAGNDTIQLRFGEDLSTSDITTNLKNIETLDLSIGGSNAVGDNTQGLSAQDVLDITGGSDVLTIDGDSDDSVYLSNEWVTNSVVSGGYVAYTNAGNNAVVNIAEDIFNSNNVDVL